MNPVTKLILIHCVFSASITSPALSGDRYDWIDFYFDKKTKVAHRLSENVYLGAVLQFDYETERNFNLAKDDDEDVSSLEPKLSIFFGYDSELLRIHSEIRTSREFLLDSPDNRRGDLSFEVLEAYWTLLDPDQNSALSFGRRSIKDEREWLFDEELDGVQFTWREPALALDLMYGREEILPKDLLDMRDETHPDFYYARLYGNTDLNSVTSVYGLYRHDRNFGDGDLYWIGGSITGKPTKSFNYWAEGAVVLGDNEGREVRGYGFDIGATLQLTQFPLRPRFTTAYAFGSGDDEGSKDTAFRQTGVHGNGGDFGGRATFQYYGELLDPNLSNLEILTLGVGIEIQENTSIDLIYHHYTQDVADNRISGDALDRNPNGNSKSIGEEIDLVVGFRNIDNIDIDLYGGVFIPGDAFEENNAPAWFSGIKASIEF